MNFRKVSSKNDPVIAYANENGTIKITKRPGTMWIVRRISLFNIMGEIIGEYETLEEAIKAF